MHCQIPLRRCGKSGTSNARLDHHRKKLVVYVHWVALWVLLANPQVQGGNEKVGVDDGDMAPEADVTIDDEYESAPLSYLQW